MRYEPHRSCFAIDAVHCVYRILRAVDDPKVNSDGSTNGDTWTTPDDYASPEEAQDKLDPFKPLTGRREVCIPEGTPIKKGNTPGGEGIYKGAGGGNETFIPGGLPSGSVGPWSPL